MNYNVIQRFRDKESLEVFEVGDTFQSDNKTRVLELKRNGFIEDAPKQESILDGNVQEIIELLTKDLGREKLLELLDEESKGKDRKTVKEHIESLLSEDD
jgi:hypothetical protein